MMSLQTEQEKILIKREFDNLLKYCSRCTPEEIEVIHKAFTFANEAHLGVRRKSGEPYILHPLAVAKIVAHEIGLGHKSISAALLHDVVEDTDYTLEDIKFRFGDKIMSLVDGLTKIEGAFDKNQSKQAENFKKILLTLVDDVRVILIKLADRLHNMRTLDAMSTHKKVLIASETLYLFAPLAHRMGFFAIKSELEDLSLKHYQPEAYAEIKEKITNKEIESESFVQEFEQPIINKLQSAGIVFKINSRFKSVYSTWRKMQTKNIPFEEVYDLFAIRIVFEPTINLPERTQCWHIYSLITEIYRSKIDRLRDWAGTPKANGYEALHCTLMGPEGMWVEVQIRTERMEEIAERGMAAHWKYKNSDTNESELDKWLRQVKDNMDNPDVDALEFLDHFKLNLLSPEIIIYTPKGEARSLVQGATVLDFAYTIHSQVGNRAVAAKVNHRLCPLNHVLHSGDQVEIITTTNQKPQHEWLNYVVSVKAKSFIKNALKSEIRGRQKQGRFIIEEKLQKLGIRPSARTYRKIIEAYKQNNKEELWSNVGAGLITLENFDKVLRENTPQKWVQYWGMQLGIGGNRRDRIHTIRKKLSQTAEKEKKEPIDRKSPYLLKEEEEGQNLSYHIAECCKPIPGDDIIGFTDNNNTSVTVHKKKCPTAARLAASQGDRIINAQWTAHKILSFLEVLAIRGIDRIGVLNELTMIITGQLNVNIRKLNIESHDGIFEGMIELYIHDTNDLQNLIKQVSGIKGMDSVKRVEEIHEDLAPQ